MASAAVGSAVVYSSFVFPFFVCEGGGGVSVCHCFVLQYFVSSQVLRSSRLGRESWLLYFCCVLNVMSLLSFFDSFSHRPELVCGM